MALRTLGSSLIGKAGVGSRTRELSEQQIATPNLPEKGQIGTVTRELVQDPLERPVPGGSNKIVGQSPAVESAVLALPEDSMLEPNVTPPLPGDVTGGAVGLSPERGAPSIPNGAANQPLFQGGVSPTNRPQPAARVQQGVGGKVTGQTGGQAQVASSYRPTPSPSVNVQGAQSPQFEREGLFTAGGNALFNTLSSKVYASDGGGGGQPSNQPVKYTPTTGQFLAGGAGKVLSGVGQAVNNPQLRSLGNQMQSFGGQPTVSRSGAPISQPGSVSSGLRSLAQNVGNTVSNVAKSAQSVVSNALRSLSSFNPFKKK